MTDTLKNAGKPGAVLCQLNIAHLKDAMDSPLLAGFRAQLDSVNATAEASPGFVWRLKDDNNNATAIPNPWGADFIVNLSVWDSPDALKTFAYQQRNHVDVLRQRDQWFHKMTSPHMVMWWQQGNTLPTVAEAHRRLEHLTQNGNNSLAFDFRASPTSEQALAPDWHVKTLVRFADDALIHAQRIVEWCGHGPILEEDIALSNIGLDYIGQARHLYAHAGLLEGQARGENELAYFRNTEDFLNTSLVELPNSSTYGEQDYAVAMAKLFLHAAWMQIRWLSVAQSTDPVLRAVANKAMKENRYHVEHASQWMIRFGDGTEESHARAQAALDQLWPYTNEWFADDVTDIQAAEHGLCALQKPLREQWLSQVNGVLKKANLQQPTPSEFLSQGRQGAHTESLSYLLGEMQSLARQHPGVEW